MWCTNSFTGEQFNLKNMSTFVGDIMEGQKQLQTENPNSSFKHHTWDVDGMYPNMPKPEILDANHTIERAHSEADHDAMSGWAPRWNRGLRETVKFILRLTEVG